MAKYSANTPTDGKLKGDNVIRKFVLVILLVLLTSCGGDKLSKNAVSPDGGICPSTHSIKGYNGVYYLSGSSSYNRITPSECFSLQMHAQDAGYISEGDHTQNEINKNQDLKNKHQINNIFSKVSVNWFWVNFIGICLSCYAIHNIILRILKYKDIEVSKGKQYLLGWLVLLSVFVPAYFIVDNTKIKDGHTYYVNLFEKPDVQKNYRVPGLIFVDEGGYHLSQVYWSNGGSSSFDNWSSEVDLVVGQKVLLEDDEERTWYVELTREEVEN